MPEAPFDGESPCSLNETETLQVACREYLPPKAARCVCVCVCESLRAVDKTRGSLFACSTTMPAIGKRRVERKKKLKTTGPTARANITTQCGARRCPGPHVLEPKSSRQGPDRCGTCSALYNEPVSSKAHSTTLGRSCYASYCIVNFLNPSLLI